MKVLFLVLSAFYSLVCLADMSNYACLHLQVAVKNNTPNTCHLLTEELTNDSILLASQDITFKILPNQTSPLVDIKPTDFNGSASIELVYECGEGYYIRLDSQKNGCGHQNTVSTSVLYAANLSAVSKNTEASYWSNKPAKVVWTIE